jgi:hypothetical protein
MFVSVSMSKTISNFKKQGKLCDMFTYIASIVACFPCSLKQVVHVSFLFLSCMAELKTDLRIIRGADGNKSYF